MPKYRSKETNKGGHRPRKSPDTSAAQAFFQDFRGGPIGPKPLQSDPARLTVSFPSKTDVFDKSAVRLGPQRWKTHGGVPEFLFKKADIWPFSTCAALKTGHLRVAMRLETKNGHERGLGEAVWADFL